MYYRPYQDYNPNEQLTFVYANGELQAGTWMELIPQRLQMVIVEGGIGASPAPGQFVRVKKFTYLQNMKLIRKERITLHYGRGKLIPGLEACLGMCREGFKGRLMINGSLAYEQDNGKIPKKASLVIDLELLGITNQPISVGGDRQDMMFIDEVMELNRLGEQMVKLGQLVRAQGYYDRAYDRIQSTRSKDIKSYLFNSSKVNSKVSNKEKTDQQVQIDQRFLIELYKAWDSIRLKGIEVALLNKDYLKVIIMTKQCMLESRLSDNPRLLGVRARALAQFGQFNEAEKIITHLCLVYPKNSTYRDQRQRILLKKEEILKETKGKLFSEPVLACFNPNRFNRKQKKMLFPRDVEVEPQNPRKADISVIEGNKFDNPSASFLNI